MNIAERIKGILFKPNEEWQVIAGETTPIAELYRNYIVLLAAIGPVASFIAMSIVGVSLPMGGAYRASIGTGLMHAIVRYVLTLVGVYVLAFIIDALAPTFSGEKNIDQAFKLAAYSYTPGWLVGIFALTPALGFLGILGLYGIYLLYVGLPVLMKSPHEKSTGYTIAIIIAAIVIFIVIGVISRVFMPGMGRM
ncbi:MAG: YIP1 family protein [Desulfofustis sp.]|nr:YIP1 family protein [Desulfofustis sp.]